MRNGSRIVGAALFLAAPTGLVAQSPGSVESELKYALEHLEAGKWDYAMWGYEAVLRRDPGNAEAQAGYMRAKAADEAKRAGRPVEREVIDAQPARRPGCTEIKMPWHTEDPCATVGEAGGTPAQPALAGQREPQADPVLPAAGLNVGDYVEFDRFSDDKWGRFGTITRLNGDPNSTCPSYFVEEAGGGITLSYVCNRIRPATKAQVEAKVAADEPKIPASGPPAGSYFCTYGLNRPQVLGPGRTFEIRSGGRYAAGDGEAGTYSYDAGSGRISFRGGFFGRMNAWGQFVGGRLSQIDINPEGGLLSFCSKQ